MVNNMYTRIVLEHSKELEVTKGGVLGIPTQTNLFGEATEHLPIAIKVIKVMKQCQCDHSLASNCTTIVLCEISVTIDGK